MNCMSTSPHLPIGPQLLIGLGNPGAQYAGNRHNIGFMAIDAIAKRYGFKAYQHRFQGETVQGEIDGRKVMLLKPLTFMNLSGQSAGEMARFYKIPLSHITVLYDELDLGFARIRVKRGGGSGGHNGIKSLDAHLGTDYLRARLGIGHPGEKHLVTNYVLSDFAKAEEPMLGTFLGAVAEHIPLLLAGDEPGFMSKVSQTVNPPPPKPVKPSPPATPQTD